MAESLLIITGSMGAGKTTVLASDILAGRGIVHAAIDMDALGFSAPSRCSFRLERYTSCLSGLH